MTGNIKAYLSGLPDEISTSLHREFSEIQKRYINKDFQTAELHCARFGETILRYLEWKNIGHYTKFGNQINRSKIIGQIANNTSLNESLRFLIPKATEILLEIRNNRDVAHVGRDIDVQEMDATLVVRVCSWILAEIIRLESKVDNIEIQKLIDKLSQKDVPFVEEIEGDLVILYTELSAKDKTLLALYHTMPQTASELLKVIGYNNQSRYKSDILKNLNLDKLIHIKDNKLFITSKGISRVEKKILIKLEI